MSMTTPFVQTYAYSNGLKTVLVNPNLGNINNDGYIMTLRLTDADGLFAVLKQPLNAEEKAIFDVSEILRITDPTYGIHDGNTILSNGSVRRVVIEAREVWDTGMNTISTDTGFIIHGAQQFNDGLLFNADNVGKFTTGFEFLQSQPDDFGVVGILLPNGLVSEDVDYEVFNEAGTSLQTFSSATALVTTSETTRIQHFPAFPKSIEEGLSISLNSNWSYYTITFLGETLTVTRECGRPFKNFRLSFWNTLGGWDYFNFDLNYRETIEIDREEYAKVYGSWSASTFGYAQHERGRAVYDSKTVERVTVNAKVTQAESEALKNLLGSREVQLLDGSVGRPIMVTDTSFPVFHDMDRTRKTLTVTFEMAHEIKNA